VETKNLGKTSSGMEANVAGLLSYVLGPITGLIFFLMEKDNKFVRFHAFQSIVVFGALFIVQVAAGFIITTLAMMHASVVIPLFVLLLNLVALVSLILWILLMVKAYQGEKFKLPVAGDIAEKNS
jgi:uncharacterized membrane protein